MSKATAAAAGSSNNNSKAAAQAAAAAAAQQIADLQAQLAAAQQAAADAQAAAAAAQQAAAVPSIQSRQDRVRQDYKGVPMCALLRVLGNRHSTLSNKTCMQAIYKLGLQPSPTTVHIQSANGRGGLSVPSVSADILQDLDKAVQDVTGKALP